LLRNKILKSFSVAAYSSLGKKHADHSPDHLGSMQRASEAAREGDLSYFEDLEDGEVQRLCQLRDEDGRTLFHSAITSGATPLVEVLLQRGGGPAAVNTADEEGWTPLHSAASCGHASLTALLLSLGADTDAATVQERTPLHYACSKGHADVARLLLNSGAGIDARDCTGATALHRSASAGKTETLRMLLQHPKARGLLNVRDKAGATPLLAAAESGHADTVVLLIEHGASVEAADADGELSAAVERHSAVRHALKAALSRKRQAEAMDGWMDE
jgi:26S proteasome non-ATPase regulatory subunit 10